MTDREKNILLNISLRKVADVNDGWNSFLINNGAQQQYPQIGQGGAPTIINNYYGKSGEEDDEEDDDMFGDVLPWAVGLAGVTALGIKFAPTIKKYYGAIKHGLPIKTKYMPVLQSVQQKIANGENVDLNDPKVAEALGEVSKFMDNPEYAGIVEKWLPGVYKTYQDNKDVLNVLKSEDNRKGLSSVISANNYFNPRTDENGNPIQDGWVPGENGELVPSYDEAPNIGVMASSAEGRRALFDWMTDLQNAGKLDDKAIELIRNQIPENQLEVFDKSVGALRQLSENGTLDAVKQAGPGAVEQALALRDKFQNNEDIDFNSPENVNLLNTANDIYSRPGNADVFRQFLSDNGIKTLDAASPLVSRLAGNETDRQALTGLNNLRNAFLPTTVDENGNPLQDGWIPDANGNLVPSYVEAPNVKDMMGSEEGRRALLSYLGDVDKAGQLTPETEQLLAQHMSDPESFNRLIGITRNLRDNGTISTMQELGQAPVEAGIKFMQDLAAGKAVDFNDPETVKAYRAASALWNAKGNKQLFGQAVPGVSVEDMDRYMPLVTGLGADEKNRMAANAAFSLAKKYQGMDPSKVRELVSTEEGRKALQSDLDTLKQVGQLTPEMQKAVAGAIPKQYLPQYERFVKPALTLANTGGVDTAKNLVENIPTIEDLYISMKNGTSLGLGRDEVSKVLDPLSTAFKDPKNVEAVRTMVGSNMKDEDFNNAVQASQTFGNKNNRVGISYFNDLNNSYFKHLKDPAQWISSELATSNADTRDRFKAEAGKIAEHWDAMDDQGRDFLRKRNPNIDKLVRASKYFTTGEGEAPGEGLDKIKAQVFKHAPFVADINRFGQAYKDVAVDTAKQLGNTAVKVGEAAKNIGSKAINTLKNYF